MIEFASVHPPARRPYNPNIGDDRITVFTRVNDKRYAITHSRHINLEQQDIVAAVQQVSPQSIVALPNTRDILLPHTTPTDSRKTNNKGCCVAH